jgi:FkbM family methyltransferase
MSTRRLTASVRGAIRFVKNVPPVGRAAARVIIAAQHVAKYPQRFDRLLFRLGVVRRPLPDGQTLVLTHAGHDSVSIAVFQGGWAGYEPETSQLFRKLAARARITLDIGAHVGYFSLLAGFANPSGRVFAFEPLPSLQIRLGENVRANRLTNVDVVPCGAAERTGTAKLFFAPTVVDGGVSSLSAEFASVQGATDSVRVRVVTLDGFADVHDLRGVDLVKVDTESTESEVLSGMRGVLNRDHPIVICEVLARWARPQAMEDLLAPMGYRYYLLTDHGPAIRTHIQPHERWRNYLFTSADPEEVGTW